MKKLLIRTFALIFALAITLTAPFSVMAFDYYGKCIDVTKTYKNNTIKYLNEVYTEKYPELALRLTYGRDEDKKAIGHLAEEITKDLKTDKEKADAIAHWVKDNIAYRTMYSAFPMDSLYDRIGNCMSYAILIQDMLRSLKIPAAHGGGFLGDMKLWNLETVRSQDAGHTWCFAYIDHEWVLYDPLAGNYGLSMDLALEEWYYFQDVEAVTPIYNSDITDVYSLTADDIPYNPGEMGIYYFNGHLYDIDNGSVTDVGNINITYNNKSYQFVNYTGEKCGYYYADQGPEAELNIPENTCFTNGWITYDDMFYQYAYENGVLASGTFMELNGKEYFMSGGKAMRVFAPMKDVTVIGGEIAVPVGYKGRVILTDWYLDKIESDEYTVTMTSDAPEVATVDNDGYVTSKGKKGWINVSLECRRNEDDGLLSMDKFTIYFEKQKRKLDFSGKVPKSDIPPSVDSPAKQTTASALPAPVVAAISVVGGAAIVGGGVAVSAKLGLFRFLKLHK